MEQIKTYSKLEIPKDSAWGRFSIWRYLPNWLRQFYEGCSNLINWFPVIWKDRNWDDHYIFEVLKKKLLFQRKELINANRHVHIWQVNRDITICLNLIEKFQSGYYETEYQDYCKEELKFSPVEGKEDVIGVDIITTEDNFEPYIKKYKKACSEVVNGAYMGRLPFTNKDVAFFTSQYNQERAHKLLFKILEQRIRHWWD